MLATKKEFYFKSTSSAPATSNLKENEYLFYEVPKELALEFEADQGDLVLKGNNSNQAILCSSKHTFALRKAETSNLLLIGQERSYSELERQNINQDDLSIAFTSQNTIGSLTGMVEILHSGNHFVEAVKITPSFKGLFQYLLPYKGQQDERRLLQQGVMPLSTEDLESRVQSSRHEMLKYLESVHAFEFNGGWRMLDVEHGNYVLKLILNHLLENSLPLESKLYLSDITASLAECNIPEQVAFHVLERHSASHSRTIRDHEFILSNDKISRSLGERLLAKIDTEMPMSEFCDAWKDGCQIYSIEWDIAHLDGLYLIEKDRLEPSIVYFPKHLLPINDKQRFQELFKIRSKWKKEDLLPYICELAPSLKDLDSIILKHSRVSRLGAATFLSARNAQYQK